MTEVIVITIMAFVLLGGFFLGILTEREAQKKDKREKLSTDAIAELTKVVKEVLPMLNKLPH